MNTAERKSFWGNKTVVYFYLFSIFSQLFFWLPIYTEFQKIIGLTTAEIFRIQSIYYVVFCLLELPTGLVADQIGRVRSLRLGAVILVVSHVLALTVQNYLGFMLHFTLIAVARSFFSGASSAYIYDYLVSIRRADTYRKVEGNGKALSLLGRVICWPAVGLMMSYSPNLPYLLTGISVFISLVVVFCMPEDYAKPKENKPFLQESVNLAKRLIAVAKMIRGEPVIQILICQGIAIFIMGRLCQVNLFQPLLKSREFSIHTFGMIMSVMSVVEALGASSSRYLRRWLTDFSAVTVLSLIASLAYGILATSGQLGTLAGLGLFALVVGMFFPLQRQLLIDSVRQADFRATVLSLEALIDRLGLTVATWVLGGAVEGGRLNLFVGCIAVSTGCWSFLIFLVGRKKGAFGGEGSVLVDRAA